MLAGVSYGFLYLGRNFFLVAREPSRFGGGSGLRRFLSTVGGIFMAKIMSVFNPFLVTVHSPLQDSVPYVFDVCDLVIVCTKFNLLPKFVRY